MYITDNHYYQNNLIAAGSSAVDVPPPPVPGQEYAASSTLPTAMPPIPSGLPQHSQAASGVKEAGLIASAHQLTTGQP